MKLFGPMIRQKEQLSNPRLAYAGEVIEVRFVDPWWKVTDQAGNLIAQLNTQQQAIDLAERLARGSRTRLRWHSRSGEVQAEKDFSTPFSRSELARRSANSS
jgi:Uncharacterized protein conserved in bacteria (DUF2188)